MVTDRRSYHFALKLRTDGGAPPTYELAFRYRQSPRRIREEAQNFDLEEAFQKPPASPEPPLQHERGHGHRPYELLGRRTSSPRSSSPAGRISPAIYMVDADGRESVVERHTAGPANEIVVVHKVAAHWVLQARASRARHLERRLLGGGAENDTGTASADVKRVLWR